MDIISLTNSALTLCMHGIFISFILKIVIIILDNVLIKKNNLINTLSSKLLIGLLRIWAILFVISKIIKWKDLYKNDYNKRK